MARLASVGKLLVLGFGITLPILLSQACSPNDDGTGHPFTNDAEAPLFDADLGDGSLSEDAACGEIELKAKIVPVTLYIMMDKSSSMAGTKWNGAVQGLTAFVDDPDQAGLTVGLGFFPRPPDNVPECDQPAYETPKVAFGALPGNAEPIKEGLAGEAPDGFSTPIYPALGGALLAGIQVATANPDMAAAVLLVTDGLPQQSAAMCGSVDPEDQSAIVDLAKTAFEYKPSIKTFVVGLPGADQTFSNLVAAAGGTEKAILVSSNNIQTEFTDALKKVAGSTLPCEYQLPAEVATGEIDTDRVNIVYTPGPAVGGEPETIPLNYACEGDGKGWHYDNASNPTKIILCPTTCAALGADLEGEIQILLGCSTVIAK